jgi:cyclophilin family peptidyl-prolyl cis-trans isomerase
MKRIIQCILGLTLIGAVPAFGTESAPTTKTDAKSNPHVRITTNLGVIEVELFADKAPETVKNFLQYVDADFYQGTVFHRVIPGFMAQGGGFTAYREGISFELNQKPVRAPVKNEADNGLQNVTGTVAMARTDDPHSATAQFFINVADNSFLDHTDKTVRGWGYCVFGKVTRGMSVIKKIEASATKTVGPFENVPVKDVVIQNVQRIKAARK